MATVATPADQATEILKNLTLDSQTKTVEAAAPEATKKGSVDAGDANGQVQSQERATPPFTQDYVDSSMCYVPNAYPSYYYGYENSMTGDWGDDYSRYMSQDGVEMTHGVYGDNGSLLYHHGYGYAPYGTYSPAGSPVPTMGHDGLYGPQHYQYPSPYYQPPTPPPSGPYSSNQTSAAPTDVPTSGAADQAPASVEANGNSNGVSKGSVGGGNNNNGTAPVKSANTNTNSNLSSNGSYGRGVLPGGVPSYQDPRFSYDGMRPWLDDPVFPDGQARPATSSSLSSTVSHINGHQSGRNQNLRSIPTNIMGLHSQRPGTGMTTPGFMNKYYPPASRLYGQCGNNVRTGFGSNGYDSRANGRGVYYAVDNKYKPRGRGNGYYGYGNENMDGLNELNRGPRARGFKNQKGFTPITLAVKGQVLPSSGVNEEKESATVAPNKEEYNKADFPEKYAEAKFFIIKSYSEDDVHKSIKYSVWASTPNGNKKLDAGYKEAQEKAGGCPVFLLFSVNTSGQFVGLAEMTGPVDFNNSVEYWQQDKWNGCFPVKWHIVKDVPNSLLKHITLENNDNKPVTNSRDTQEVKFEQGLQLIKIFKDHLSKTCILDDFGFYEGRQKTIQEKRAKQQIHKQVWDSKPTADAAVADTNEKDKEGANGKVSLPEPLEASSVLVKESSVIDGEPTKQQLEENGSVKVSADAPKGGKPVVATTEKRVLSNGNGVVANGC